MSRTATNFDRFFPLIDDRWWCYSTNFTQRELGGAMMVMIAEELKSRERASARSDGLLAQLGSG